jgi:hypothetical protein
MKIMGPHLMAILITTPTRLPIMVPCTTTKLHIGAFLIANRTPIHLKPLINKPILIMCLAMSRALARILPKGWYDL